MPRFPNQRQPVFSAAHEELLAKWQSSEDVITDSKAFRPLPSKAVLWAKKLARRITPWEEKVLQLPDIRFFSVKMGYQTIGKAQWMADSEENFVVVKNNVMHGTEGHHTSAPREVIGFHYGYAVSTSIAAAKLWEQKDEHGETVYKSVSLKALPYVQGSGYHNALSCRFLVQTLAFQQEIAQEDPAPSALICGQDSLVCSPIVVPIDHGFSMQGDMKGPCPNRLIYVKKGVEQETFEAIRGHLALPEPRAQIHEMMSASLSEVVYRAQQLASTASFGNDDNIQKIIDGLCYPARKI